MHNPTRKSIFIIVIAAILVITGCRQTNSSSDSVSSQKSTITISGAWALYPMMVRWSEEYQKQFPEVRFDISAGGAGKGMADALAGTVDIGMVSREIYPEEIDKGAYSFSVTKDAVFPTINTKNPVLDDLSQKGVTRDILMRIFINGEVSSWGEVVGREDVTDAVHVFTRSDACGAAATWADYLGALQEDIFGVAVYGDPGLLEAVIKDPLAIGYNNLNYIFDIENGAPVAGAQLLPIDSNENGVADQGEIFTSKDMAIQAVASGQYPSPPARNLYLVTRGKPNGLVKDFINWVLSEGQVYVGETGYITLPGEMLDAELDKLE